MSYRVVLDFDRSINWSASEIAGTRGLLFFEVCSGETVAMGFVKRAVTGFAGGSNDDEDDEELFVGVIGSSAARSLFAS